jgi:hypothetical protein
MTAKACKLVKHDSEAPVKVYRGSAWNRARIVR